jgi:hypothetical protein
VTAVGRRPVAPIRRFRGGAFAPNEAPWTLRYAVSIGFDALTVVIKDPAGYFDLRNPSARAHLSFSNRAAIAPWAETPALSRQG